MKNKLHEIEHLFDHVLREVQEPGARITYLLRLYYDLVTLLSEASQLHFHTLFARVSFISTRYPLGKAWAYAMQIPRREIHQREMTDQDLEPIVIACVSHLLVLSFQEIDESASKGSRQVPALPALPPMPKRGQPQHPFVRVVVTEWYQDKKQMALLDEKDTGARHILQYDVQGVNDIFTDTLELAMTEIGIPLILGLTDVTFSDDGTIIPSYIVILPDLLMDVTSIAQMQSDGSDPDASHILDLFMPARNTLSLLTGHVANFLLDELIRNPSKPYPEIFWDAFRSYPVEFARMDDDTLRDMNQKMQKHYLHILYVLKERFPALGIDHARCLIEPSFFSPQYGIKGRLDLYYENEDAHTASIIELKSSKPFMPNAYGLSHAHYQQTLLYDLLIRRSLPPGSRRSNYILYSALEDDPLKFAVHVEGIQKETIQHRNQSVLLQFRLMQLDDPQSRNVFTEIDPGRYQHVKGFLLSNIAEWYSVYTSLSAGEQFYFRSFTAFVTREHTLARIGSDRGEGTGGLAGLWLDSIAAKEERYAILQQLVLVSIDQEPQQTILRFARSQYTHPLANFRSGDIAILYPYDNIAEADPTRFQLHRATVLEVNAKEVVLRLRNIQVHTRQIEQVKYWNLEHDLLDSSFKVLYQSLWTMMSSKPAVRHRLMGLLPPSAGNIVESVPAPDGLTDAQLQVFREGIRAESVYLLWGPPGTGKTSMMLKSWAWYYFHHTPKRMAILAYTNRAVDEICEALLRLGSIMSGHFIRIGSKAATGEAYRHRLLDQVIEPLKTRAEIRHLLETTSVFVGTIASFQGKSELFQFVDFDVLIMDEASQVLEPSMVGLLSRFKKTILIGDHMQLPAISVQTPKTGLVSQDQAWPKKIGLTDMRMSYFERMFRLYQANGWEQGLGILHEQGRMHASIQQFANTYVYHGILKTVHHEDQMAPLSRFVGESGRGLFSSHLIYIATGSSWKETYSRTNLEEAHVVLRVLKLWQERIRQYHLTWSIGIITPFRAQIAAIQHEAHLQGVDIAEITVDTVERFQGGARDVMIMSCSVNTSSMLARITSVNSEGVDRKLNVAVTRARRQFVLIGDENILRTEPAYAGLISMSTRWTPDADEDAIA